MSLAKLGDLDRDGYDDLAVGAPYDQVGGSVFIFRGGPNGIDETPSQVIAGNVQSDIVSKKNPELTFTP